MDILETITANTRREVAWQKQTLPVDALLRLGSPWLAEAPRSMRRALAESETGIIAEFKRRSPSKGWLHEDAKIEAVVPAYEAGGASACSVLTDSEFFGGTLEDLQQARRLAALPLLRKDFIFDPLQVRATAATPAAALLLIVALTPDAALLRRLREQAESLGMQAVVEVCGKKDLVLARESGARIIQVNARDLDTLRVDRQACLELARQCPPERGEIWIAASGMDSRDHLEEAARAGFSAALVGTALMQEGQPGAALRRLLRGREEGHHAA